MSNAICSFDDCSKRVDARGWCKTHYSRWRRTGDPKGRGYRPGPRTVHREMDLAERLWIGFERRETGCWEWSKTVTQGGYGQLSVAGTVRYAHRVMYETVVEPIPDGLELDHLCRNRRCVNPSHLEPVTSKENTRRGIAAGGGPWSTRRRSKAA